MQALKRNAGSGRFIWYHLTALFVAVVIVTKIGLEILPDWHNVKGWEAYWIAQDLTTGKGYSFPSTEPWPYDPIGVDFHPTAWTDPLYTFCLAGIIWIFGSYHQLAAAVFNLVLLFSVFGLTYLLGERLISAPAGVMAVIALAHIGGFSWAVFEMNNTMLAANLVVLSALMLLKFLDDPSYRHAGALGLVLGLTVLGCPGAQFFIPVAVAAIAVLGRRNLEHGVPKAILVLVVAAFTVLPWTARNYLVFGEFVPVRTGVGQITFVGLVSTAGTVAPEKLRSHIKPPLSAGTPRLAVKQATQRDKLRTLERFQEDYAKEVGPAEYATMNEAQRDSWLLQETKAFLLANLVLSAQLAITKIEVFIRIMGSFGVLVCLLAALGGFLAFKTPTVLTLALWIGSYVGPFLIVICYYDRYRAPIEPLLVVLAAFAVWRVIEIGSRKLSIDCRRDC